METTMVLQQEAVPIVRSGLQMKRKSLELNLRQYQQQLATFERQYQMTSEQFRRRFSAGDLGDDAVWFEWEFVLDAYHETIQQLSVLEKIRL
ncbi:MAG TPA: hypothetical protein PLJ78_03145 [Anaerolineae bacterium]|nr:hypothetical protein [Anaerolineae bacterium]HQK12924.1 hypothetical protein [Anaerolineae bacterium]